MNLANFKLKLDSRTLSLILIGLLGLLVVGFFATAYLGISVLSAKSRDVVSLKTQSQSAENQLTELQQAKKEVQKYAYFKDVATTVIPNDKDQAEAVLEIYQMASQSGIAIQSITFPASTLGSTGTQSATASSATKTALTQAKPVPGIAGLYSLELTITPQSGVNVPAAQQVTYPKMLDFLNRIENNRHTAQITQLSIATGSDSQGLSFTLTINIFIKP